jgi:hypothetical protein
MVSAKDPYGRILDFLDRKFTYGHFKFPLYTRKQINRKSNLNAMPLKACGKRPVYVAEM